jgi:hypothetical protein
MTNIETAMAYLQDIIDSQNDEVDVVLANLALIELRSAGQGGVSREEAIAEYRQDELDAVMYFVDKWFNKGDQRLKDNPATRASSARELALRAIEAAPQPASPPIPSVETLLAEMHMAIIDLWNDDNEVPLWADDSGFRKKFATTIHALLTARLGGSHD